MLDLKVFQTEAAKLISDRYSFYAGHPDRPRKGKRPRAFFQALSALTGAGKTPILAQSVALLRAHFGAEPIVLWMSKAKPVVDQTYLNFTSGGKYSNIIDGFNVINMRDLNPTLISDSSTPLIILTTTGLFNNKDQSDGNLNIYKKDNDLFGSQSPWERLIERAAGGARRPMIIVYDEAHNLSKQQTDILAELETDAYLLASATLALPDNFQKSVIQPICLWIEEAEDSHAFAKLLAVDENGVPDARRFITTAISSERVVEAQLVKKAIQFDGTTSPMEWCLDELLKRKDLIEDEISDRGLTFKPKAIYACKTNIGDDGEKDDATKPFEHRNAPPIRIWRYLVSKGVDPCEIAIYGDLTFVKGNKPEEVNHYSGGESDFAKFLEHDYHHIIFNLSLQEGWDDPACYLAYIDKSMGSKIQVQQLIGRVLRQPEASHYGTPLLNSAHFFLRVDNQNVFSDAINSVKEKLKLEGAPIEIIENYGGAGSAADDLLPKEDVKVDLHHVYVDSEAARQRIEEIVEDFPTFGENDINTIGEAHSTSQVIEILDPGKVEPNEWKAEGHTNPVRLRWLINTAVKARSTRALAVLNVSDSKFDVRVQIHSKADKLADKMAREVVGAFYQYSDLVYESMRPFTFGTIRSPKNAQEFVNGLYERYSGFNKFELAFARALDNCKVIWHRNPASGGFAIPLLSEGDTSSFFPDFIVWKDDAIFCLDTKGGHLLSEAVARKLFDIKEDGKSKIAVRFITEGKQSALREKPSKGGYTVWKMKSGVPTPVQVSDIDKALGECLK